MNEYIAVMDIGTTGVRLLVAKVGTNGKPHIVARDYTVCHGIRKFKIENSAEVTESIRKVLHRIQEKTEIVVQRSSVSRDAVCVQLADHVSYGDWVFLVGFTQKEPVEVQQLQLLSGGIFHIETNPFLTLCLIIICVQNFVQIHARFVGSCAGLFFYNKDE